MTVDNLAGQTIKGYELQELIGAGGFGAVYRAFQPLVKREVAVKIILPDFVNQPEFIRRFEAEAQLVARLEHLHIVPLYDYWRDSTGAYLVMRWLRGGSLQVVLDKGHWPIQDSARIVDQIAAALATAHRNGVIHRDLKPANILLDEDKNAYLADFGIAKDLAHITDYSTLIEKDEGEGLLGSPDYMSPEQIRMHPIGPQSDIYSMGLLLYKLLTGRKPFEGFQLSTLISKQLQDPLPHIHEVRPDLPEALNLVISKATEKDPDKRYQDVLALAADFRKAIAVTSEETLDMLEHASPEAFELSRLGISEKFMTLDLELEPENPYKGLRAFQEADADDFFGREVLINQFIDRIQADHQSARFLAVVGPSGSGKSSVVRAGLLPKLRQGAVPGSENWFIVEMVPGTHPLEELEAALLRVAINPPASLIEQLQGDERGLIRAIKRVLPGSTSEEGELVLLIDQFEEIFTQVESEAERTFFLNSLLAAAREQHSRLRIIATLRADFYDRPLLYPDFGQLMRECTEVVLPLTRDELERAIVEPAENAGLELESGLVARIVADVGEQPGTLPLLQYALTELFERRDGRWLTVTAYNEIEGVSGALARRADEIYNELDTEGQHAARQIFLRLVTLGDGSEDTRRRVLISELLSLEINETIIQKVIDLFGKYRLLTFDHDPATRSPTVEVAHEALIRQWELLRQWLTDSREDLRMQRRLAAATTEWLNASRDASFLASGTRLEQFQTWLDQTELALTEVEQAFLSASFTKREELRAAELERQAKEAALERRSRNFLRALVAVLGVATLGALVLSAFAFNQREIAEQNASTATIAQGQAVAEAHNAATAAAVAEENALIAEINAAEARSLAFVSGAQLALANNNTELAILLGLEANQVGQPTTLTQRTLSEAAYAPGTRRVFSAHTDRVTSVAYSPDGLNAVSGARDNLVILWNLETGAVIHSMEGHNDWIWDVAYSPDGQRALSASQDHTLILWDLETGEEIRRFGANGEGHSDAVLSITFNSDGTLALSGSQDRTMILWDVETGEIVRRFEGSPATILDVAISPSGFTALSAGNDNNIILWNVGTGQPLITFGEESGGHTNEVWTVAYTPDELGMLSGSEDNSILLWSFEAGRPVQRFQGHSSRVTSVAFNKDGTRIVSGSEDNTVIVWDVATGGIIRRFIGHTFLVYAVDFSPDGTKVISAAWDGTVRLWDIENGAQVLQMGADGSTHSGNVLGVTFSPDGTLALSGASDGSLILWNVTDGTQIHRLDGHNGGVNTVAFSPDGQFALSGADDQTLILWDVATGEQIRAFEGHSDAVWTVTFSPDGRSAVSGSRDNTLILWDVQTGEQIRRFFGHTFRVTGAAFSPDGETFISSGFDNILILWNAETGEQIRTFEGHEDWIRGVAFSPNGRTAISASADNSLILWDVALGERLRRFEGHSAQVYSVAFSPDGRFIVSGSADRNIILWDIESGAEMQRFAGHTDDVRSVVFSPDGRHILSGSGDGSVRLWQIQLSLEELTQWINSNRHVRELTCAERELYDVEPLCPRPTPVLIPGQDI